MAIEIVSFPINSMVIFHSYVNVYQAGYVHPLNRSQWLGWIDIQQLFEKVLSDVLKLWEETWTNRPRLSGWLTYVNMAKQIFRSWLGTHGKTLFSFDCPELSMNKSLSGQSLLEWNSQRSMLFGRCIALGLFRFSIAFPPNHVYRYWYVANNHGSHTAWNVINQE
jgi:hypothetical protein